MKTATALMSKEEIAYNRKALIQSLEPFRQMRYHVNSIMPMRGFIVDRNAGTFEYLPPLPEWQKQLDRIDEMEREYIKSNFPEFYTENK
jgi:hypothetical protein